MATLGVGVDIVDVPRFALVLERHPKIVARLFTHAEQDDAQARPERLAARFAAKEAVLKTLQVGFGAAPWTSIEIRRDASGAPSVHLHGAAAQLADQRGVKTLHVSLSHSQLTAIAFVVGSSKDASLAR
jgi:holo-[acyl-carrier protein] synthase